MKTETSAAAWLPLAAFAGAVLLHADSSPKWSVAVAMAALAWKLLHLRGRLALPGTAWCVVIGIALAMGTGATFRGITGLAAGSNLLLVMGAAKLIETRQPRDARVMVLVSLALLMAAVLDRQALPRVPMYLASAWVSLAALAALGAGRAAASSVVALQISGRALLYALPLAALCFVLVPRLPGALWSLPPDNSALTGLGDEMSPGSISELSASDEMAFRVRFDAAPPPLAQRYWRGPVLHDFDGQTWRRSRQQAIRSLTEPVSAAVHYRILQEPTGRSFLFGLDTVESISGARALQLYDGQFLSTRPVTSAIAYQGVSHLQVRTLSGLSTVARRIDLQLPEGRNPRTLALARQLRAASRDDADYVQRVLAYFRESGLQYTLTPPLLGQNPVDGLLFDTRLGFCGHFASAYATLMRAAGVPARVVTGYLGGTWNAVGGFYAVRQSDAHAWTEVWLEGTGWARVDPTTVIAPGRLGRTLSDLLTQRATLTDRMMVRAPWLRSLRDSWDAAASWWQERVVNYNLAAQLALLRKLGMEDIDYRGLALTLLVCAALWGLWVSWRMRHHLLDHRQRDPVERLWSSYAALLGRKGVPVAAHDAPVAVARHAARRHPGLAPEITGFSEHYLKLRVGGAGAAPPAELNELRRRFRALARAARRSPAR